MRNPVAKYQRKANKGGRHRDRKNDYRRKPKHKRREERYENPR